MPGLGLQASVRACWGGLELIDFFSDLSEESRKGGFFLGSETAEDEVDVAELLAEFIVPCAKAETGEIGGVEVFGDGFETVVAAGAALGAVTKTIERQVEVVADDEDVLERNSVEIGEFGDSAAGIVVESLGFDEDFVAVFKPEGMEFGFLPGEIFDFGIKIKCQKTEVVASEVVFWARVTEPDDEFHESIITFFARFGEVLMFWRAVVTWLRFCGRSRE